MFTSILNYSQLQHLTSHPTNPDHLTVSFGLLATVSRLKGDHCQEFLLLVRILKHHPYVHGFWARLGEALTEIPEAERTDFGKRYPKEMICFCLVRAFILLQTVEGSVKAWVKERNQKEQKELKEKVDKLGLKLGEVISGFSEFRVLSGVATASSVASKHENCNL